MIQSNNTKIKRGTELVLNGVSVWCYRDKENGEVVVSEIQDLNSTTADQLKFEKKTDLKPVKKFGASIKQVVKPVSEREKKFRTELNVFFASQTLIMPDKCENCGQDLNAYGKFFRRCVSAHILEKSKFKSVAIHPKNLIFLGSSLVDNSCCCHNLYDEKGAEFRSKMNCYPLVIERFNQFKHLLTPQELIRAYTYLNIEMK